MDHPIRTSLDTALGTGAVTSPIWLQYLQDGLGMFMLLGGAVLLLLRLLIAWREWRNKK